MTKQESKTAAKRAATLREQLARELGASVETVEPRWIELLKEGVIVEVHIKRWRGKARLTLADMGLARNADRATIDETLSGLLTLGEKKLLPPAMLARLDTLDTLARRAIKESGYQTYWGTFVPCTAYESLAKRLNEYREQYLAVRDEIVTKRDEVVAQMREEYRVAATKAFRRLSVLDPTSVKGVSESDFVRSFTSAVVALIPSADVIRESFGFDTEIRFVPLPSMLASDIRRADSLIARRDESDKRKSALAKMTDAVVADARKRKSELIDGFLRDVTAQTRALLYDASTAVLESLAGDAPLHARSVVQLRRLVSRLEALNFSNDGDVKRMGDLIAKSLDGKSEGERDLKGLRETLAQIATVTRSTLLSLGADAPRPSKHLSISVTPSEVEVSRARKSLGLRDLPSVASERKVERAEVKGELRQRRSL